MKKTSDQIKDPKKQTAKSGARAKPAAYAYPITVSDEESERFQEAILHWNGLAREALGEIRCRTRSRSAPKRRATSTATLPIFATGSGSSRSRRADFIRSSRRSPII